MMIVLKANRAHTIKQTHRIDWVHGPIVVNVWHPQDATGVVPILLIHGWGGTGSYWHPLAQALSQTAPVIVPDLPGTGSSQPVKEPQNLFDQVENIKFILDSLQLNCVQIVGHSMGGAMAVLLAAAQPERVSKLVLTSLTFFKTQAQIDFYHNLIRFFRLSMRFRPAWLAGVPGMSQLMALQYFYRIPSDGTVLKQGLVDFLNLDQRTAIACAENATDPRIREAGEQVTAPSLLVAARNDNMMPKENVQFTAEIIGDCQIRWIEKCGHLPMVEKPKTYLKILQEFLDL